MTSDLLGFYNHFFQPVEYLNKKSPDQLFDIFV